MRNFKEVLTAVMAIAIFSFSCMPVPARTLIGNYGSVVPYANSTYNVGSPTQYWDYGYFSHLQVGDLVYAGNVTAHAPTHASGGADPVNHNTLSNLTTGDPHTQYIKADGTRAFAGAQSMGGNSLVTMADPTNNQDAATKIYVDTHGNVTGTGGIANMVPYWTIAQNLNSTNMYYNSVTNRYGIGTIVPELALQVHDGTGPNGIQLSYTIGSLYTNITNDIFGYLRLMPSGGRVGINDLTPIKTLDVGGDAQIQGNLTMDSHNINNVADPSAAQDAVTLAYYNAHLPAAGTGNVTALGTSIGYIPVWETNSALVNSVVTANVAGINVDGQTSSDMLQIGTATPIFPLYNGSAFMSQLQVGGTAIFKSADRSVSQLNYPNNATIPEHIGTGSYDYTGNATSERLFYSTAPIFDAADGLNPNMILLLSGTYVGAVVEIEHYISSTEVQVTDDNGWVTDLTGVSFGILPTPTFGIANSGSARFGMSGTSTLVMRSTNNTAPRSVAVVTSNAGNDVSSFQVEVENNGYNDNEAVDIVFTTGNMTTNMHSSVVKIQVDKSGAASSTNSTSIDFINLQQVGRNNSTSNGILVGQGFDTALKISGGTRIDPSYGYTVTAAHAVTNRVTGVAPNGTAFLDTSTGNVQMFLARNDYILLGSTSVFESIPVFLITGSSHAINPTYYYSTGNGTWSTLVVSDTTGGFVTNGILAFNAPIGWATTNATTPAGTAITSGYYVKIVGTRSTITTPPTESYFKLYTSSSLTDFMIRGNGTIRPVAMSDASAPNDSIYYSTTAAKLVYKDAGGIVRSLY
jgi:hypothetical protein